MIPGDARSRLDTVIERELTEEELTELVREAKKAVRNVNLSITCKHCHRQGKYDVEINNPTAAIDGITKLLEQAKGKVGQQAKENSSAVLTEISQMTDAQLAAIVAGYTPDDITPEAPHS